MGQSRAATSRQPFDHRKRFGNLLNSRVIVPCSFCESADVLAVGEADLLIMHLLVEAIVNHPSVEQIVNVEVMKNAYILHPESIVNCARMEVVIITEIQHDNIIAKLEIVQ